jgi:hypothetical protein
MKSDTAAASAMPFIKTASASAPKPVSKRRKIASGFISELKSARSNRSFFSSDRERLSFALFSPLFDLGAALFSRPSQGSPDSVSSSSKRGSGESKFSFSKSFLSMSVLFRARSAFADKLRAAASGAFSEYLQIPLF